MTRTQAISALGFLFVISIPALARPHQQGSQQQGSQPPALKPPATTPGTPQQSQSPQNQQPGQKAPSAPPVAQQGKSGENDTRAYIRSRTDAVLVPVTVKNRDGQLVGDLRSDEFRILQDGVEQKIIRFSS